MSDMEPGTVAQMFKALGYPAAGNDVDEMIRWALYELSALRERLERLEAENLRWQSEHTALKMEHGNAESELSDLRARNARMAEALGVLQKDYCSHACCRHPVLSTSHRLECDDARAALRDKDAAAWLLARDERIRERVAAFVLEEFHEFIHGGTRERLATAIRALDLSSVGREEGGNG